MARKTTVWLSIAAFSVYGAAAFAAESFDSDGDGYDDNNDNCTLTYNPDQVDSDGDYFGNRCDGDFNGDFVVNAGDLGIMKDDFFSVGVKATDLNADGVVNFADLGILKDLFFGNPGPTATDPAMPPCDCYFSRDCGNGGFCDYGGPYWQETNCFWRDDKPVAILDGCSTELELNDWIPSICDGVCTYDRRGSTTGGEDTALIAEAFRTWANAMLVPAMAGGGPVSDEIAERAMALPFNNPDISGSLGRHTADLIAMVAGDGFYEYFCHWEGYGAHEPGPVVSIEGDYCAAKAAELTLDAFDAALREPGSAAQHIAQIPKYCADWQTRFSPRCPAGQAGLLCISEHVEGLAYMLSTPAIESVPESLDQLLRAGMR